MDWKKWIKAAGTAADVKALQTNLNQINTDIALIKKEQATMRADIDELKERIDAT